MPRGPATGRRLRLRWLFLALPLLAALLALAPTAHAPSATRTGCASLRPGSHLLKLTSGGVARSAWIHVPPGGASAHPLAMVLALHGFGGNGQFMEKYSGLSGMSDRHRFVVAYPEALGAQPRWNIGGGAGTAPNDVGFIGDLIQRLTAGGCVDPGHVYATGVSNGGGMVARLGCELGDRLRAIAPVAGGYSTIPGCSSTRAVSVLEIHGTADPIVPYSGKGPARSGSVRGFLRGWLARDRCRTKSVRSTPARQIVRLDWPGCASGTAVAHLKLIGGGHEWPEARPERSDRLPPLSASKEVWQFFRRLPER